MLSVTIIFCLFAGSFAVFIEPGPCPQINNVETDLSRLAGRWYQHASTENGYVDGLKCVMHDLSLPQNSVAIAISTAELEKTGDHSIIESNITMSEDYVIRTFTSGRIIGFRSFTFQNLEVVYGSHFISLGCKNFGPNQLAWILLLVTINSIQALPEVIEPEKPNLDTLIEDTTEDYWAGSGAGPEDTPELNRTETRESLTHEASDQDAVVYLGEGAQYVPVPAIKPRVPLNPNLQALQTLQGLQGIGATGGTGGGGSTTGTGGTALSSDDEWGRHPETWDREHRRYRPNTTRVQHIEAECQDDYMKIRIAFNGSFAGLLYSAGYSYDPDCMYVNGTGRDYYEFYIQLNRCGTLGENTHHQDSRKNPTKNLMWNTVTVQYNPLIEEEFDEHFKVTCEYGYDFWKTVTFPFLDVEVATGNPVVFTLQPPECYMEIRYGYGTTGTRVAGPVRVGDPLTLIIYMRSKYDGFDIVVNDCYAHNGGNKRIQLIDQYGCPVDDKLISRFRGSWSESGLFETQVFAYMKTFRFTGSPALYIECDVRMCHGRCPSQPCHWRNSKNVAKRSLAIDGLTTPASSLSENVNLFQSLRVLQEGEAEAEVFQNTTTASHSGVSEATGDKVCLRSTVVNTIVGFSCGLICIMAGTLLVLCSRIRRAAREKLLSDSLSYMTHKGRIN